MNKFLLCCMIVFHFAGCSAPASSFKNLEPTPNKSFVDIFRWRFLGSRDDWPDWVESKQYKPEIMRNHSTTEIMYSVVNHSTILIQWHGLNILTDPIYSERSSPLSWIGPKRVRKPGISFDDLPPIDLVLISHNHYDHLDLETLKRLQKRDNPEILIGLENGHLLRSEEIENYKEFDWWDSIDKGGLKITFVPARHWSARGLFDRKETLWGGFSLQDDQGTHVYFAGDTGYGNFFKKIVNILGPVHLSFLPIGAYAPRWFMKYHHMDPEDAIKAHKVIHSRRSVGVHFETFRLTDESYEAPRQTLNELWSKEVDPKSEFIAPEFGKTYTFKSIGNL
ncbi:MAG: hypothetical protein CME63_03205 [Halobacteriovoraceae bacterium]|nr:hypothetical protein [Halobacteriovoraceae bacterium]